MNKLNVTPPTLEESLERYISSTDRGDFMTMLENAYPDIIGVAHWLVKDPDNAEDVVQEVFIRAITSYKRFERGGKRGFLAWLKEIARICALENWRSHNRQRTPVERDYFRKEQESDPVFSALIRELGEEIKTAIEGLPSGQQIVIILRYNDGLEPSEIAEILGIPQGAVQKRLDRARKPIYEHLARQGYPGL